MRRALHIVTLLLATLLGADGALAQQAGAFARYGFGARGIAMGNAVVADASGFASPYYNPALAPFIGQQSLEVSAALMTLDRQLQFAQLSTPLRPRAGIAGGLVYASVGDFDGRNISGYHTGTFATHEFAFFVAFGVRLGSRATVGVGFQLFRSDLYHNVPAARSIGLDVGASFLITERLRAGAVVEDLLAKYSWDTSEHHSAGGTTRDRFPQRLRVGASYQWERLLVSAELESRYQVMDVQRRSVEVVGNSIEESVVTEQLRAMGLRFRAGAEYYLVPSFAVRAGATTLGQGALRPSTGVVFEQPVDRLTIRAAYAFVLEPFALGTAHLISLQFYL